MTTVQIRPPKQRYATVVKEDEATDGSRVFVAEIPALPGCMSHGETPEEALQNLSEAVELYLEAMAEGGQPAPAPRQAPLTLGTGLTGGTVLRSNYDLDATIRLELVPH